MIVATKPGRSRGGRLLYVESDFAFHFTPGAPDDDAVQAPSGRGSLLLGTLQIEVSSDTGELLYAWGYCPRHSWQAARVRLPHWSEGRLFVRDPPPPGVGVSVWPSILAPLFDSESGVLQISSGATDPRLGDDLESTMIATGVIVGVRQGRIERVWLVPSAFE